MHEIQHLKEPGVCCSTVTTHRRCKQYNAAALLGVSCVKRFTSCDSYRFYLFSEPALDLTEPKWANEMKNARVNRHEGLGVQYLIRTLLQHVKQISFRQGCDHSSDFSSRWEEREWKMLTSLVSESVLTAYRRNRGKQRKQQKTPQPRRWPYVPPR